MEEQTQKILSLQEEIIHLQKMSYNQGIETVKKLESYKRTNITLLIVTLLALAYSFLILLVY